MAQRGRPNKDPALKHEYLDKLIDDHDDECIDAHDEETTDLFTDLQNRTLQDIPDNEDY